MINLALIGIGDWGRNYLSTIKAFPNCQIKYVCSRSPEKLLPFNENFIKTTNFKELLKYQDIDGVIIATPGSTHYQIAKELLKKGFNLLIEKPLTINYKDTLKLKTSAKVLVGHIYLFDPAFLKAKQLLKKIGPIQYVSYEAINKGPYRSDMSVLWDLGPHPISLLLDIYQKDPIQIQAWGINCLKLKSKLLDMVMLKMKFPDKTQAFVKISWLSPIKRRELTIVGVKSTLVYNDLQPNRLTLFENMGSKVKHPSYPHRLPLEVELGEFIDAISKNRAIERSNLDFGIRVTKLLSFAEQSIRKEGAIIDVR